MKHVWLWPVVIGITSLGGLGSGLVLDGWWDCLAWLGLGIPVATGGVGWWGRHTRSL
mgnify:CR=1 FL=1